MRNPFKRKGLTIKMLILQNTQRIEELEREISEVNYEVSTLRKNIEKQDEFLVVLKEVKAENSVEVKRRQTAKWLNGEHSTDIK